MIAGEKVTAVVVTRGDHDLSPIFDSFVEAGFEEGEVLVWNNSLEGLRDNKVYGRYTAAELVKPESLVYVQDDDLVMQPGSIEKIVKAWTDSLNTCGAGSGDFDPRLLWHADSKDITQIGEGKHVVCNMPARFRENPFYAEHSLVGFGAVFHPCSPARAFKTFMEATGRARRATSVDVTAWEMDDLFLTTCDIVFTALTPRVLVDVPYDDLPWASDDTRMWKQPWHQSVRDEMLEQVLKVRKESA